MPFAAVSFSDQSVTYTVYDMNCVHTVYISGSLVNKDENTLSSLHVSFCYNSLLKH